MPFHGLDLKPDILTFIISIRKWNIIPSVQAMHSQVDAERCGLAVVPAVLQLIDLLMLLIQTYILWDLSAFCR